jgi:hypothetical protein
MKDFEKRCNDRASPLNAYLVLYTTVDEKRVSKVHKTIMICPSPAHVVVRFPTAVKMELLSDGVVSIVPVIAQELQDEEVETPLTPPATQAQEPVIEAPPPRPPVPPTPAPMVAPVMVAPVGAPAQNTPAPAKAPVMVGDPAQARRIPYLPGLQLCRVCAFSPFTNPSLQCSSNPKGHRFDKDPATKRCDQFKFKE